MRTTRRAAATTSGAVVLALAGCTVDGGGSSSGPEPDADTSGGGGSGVIEPDAEEAADLSALDRAVAVTEQLLADLSAARPRLDPGRRLTHLHQAHLTALRSATSRTAPSSTPAPPPPRRLDPRRLRKREVAAQRELADLARRAHHGGLARMLASMSAGVAAALAQREANAGVRS